MRNVYSLFFNGLFGIFYEGSNNRYDRGSSIILDPPFRGVPLPRQSYGKFSPTFYVIGLHFGTGIIDVSLTHFSRKQASDYTWWPINIDDLLYLCIDFTVLILLYSIHSH